MDGEATGTNSLPRATSGANRDARRVLIVHNWHRSDQISGENRSVEADIVLLRSAGVEVETYSRSNDEISNFGPAQWAGLALRPTLSPHDARVLRRLVGRFRPDVIHLHNPMPLISPWVVRTARASGVPLVQTVHNYQHVCVAKTYFRDGHPCHDCQGRSVPWPAVLHGCYHGSRAQSAVLGLSLAAHRSTWRLVDRFLAVGGAVARHLEKAGIDPKRITVRDIPVADPGTPSPTTTGGALYVGRLSHEKGAHLLLDAWRRSKLGMQHRLRLAGDGPDRAKIERVASGTPGVELLGVVPHQRTLDLMVESSFVVVPSLWEEPGCTAAREAMARGRPVLATNRGVLADIVDEEVGWVVEPTVEGMTTGLRAAFEAPLEPLGVAARRRFEERFSPPASLRALLRVYAEVKIGSG
jgi:glycosyltransferase involved in cell wall biosynthesis